MQAVGASVQAFIDVMPALELIVGKQASDGENVDSGGTKPVSTGDAKPAFRFGGRRTPARPVS